MSAVLRPVVLVQAVVHLSIDGLVDEILSMTVGVRNRSAIPGSWNLVPEVVARHCAEQSDRMKRILSSLVDRYFEEMCKAVVASVYQDCQVDVKA